MKRENFTGRTVSDFQCKPGKSQSLHWDAGSPGLGLRVTSNEKKTYIFETKLHGKTLRLTIGDVLSWPLADARKEASRLKVLTDQGIDPRQLEKEKKSADEARRQRERLEKITLSEVWAEYIEDRKHLWSDLHYRDHVKIIHAGGEVRSRSNELTVSGALASLSPARLVDLTSERVEEWAKAEALNRPTRARLALRLLKAFLFWCNRHSIYKEIVTDNAAQSKTARESLGKAKAKNDVLQREQLPAWFQAIRQIQNHVISAYLQALLLTGARREELAQLRWEDCDFQWKNLTIRDKVDGQRVIPLTPYVFHLLSSLPRRNQWVFSSPTAASGRLTEPAIAHRKACAIACVDVSLHGLRRSFATLSEWVEMPAGIAAQIQGHKPQGVREQNYIRRPLDLLRMWHIKIEGWILEEAEIEFDGKANLGLRAIK
ncbi:integrase family protein [Nitrosomonas sp. Is37]|uniref:tyrosine-type recombinase/integrase n=1 Tax=Nitrosomonas sp. Is37 TaxID=3080535 RepID=UPI00294B8A0A|nr:integrase family protein [Nitrosomonas sp. Is37]MDV6345530.1 integrase family protein [Nitrosomonas sp. Is37]